MKVSVTSHRQQEDCRILVRELLTELVASGRCKKLSLPAVAYISSRAVRAGLACNWFFVILLRTSTAQRRLHTDPY